MTVTRGSGPRVPLRANRRGRELNHLQIAGVSYLAGPVSEGSGPLSCTAVVTDCDSAKLTKEGYL